MSTCTYGIGRAWQKPKQRTTKLTGNIALLFYCEIWSILSANFSQVWRNPMQKFQFCSFLACLLSCFFSIEHNLKTIVCIWMFCTTGDFHFLVWSCMWATAGACTMAPKHALWPLSNTPFVHTFMYNLNTMRHIQIFYVLSNTFIIEEVGF